LKKQGNLYLIPTPIVDQDLSALPQNVIGKLHEIKHFIVERARTSRRLISLTKYPGDISELNFTELDKREPGKLPRDLFDPILNGEDMGLMSEAGMPGIADPGALIVKKAHYMNIRVIPMTGPSSIFLALAASGLNGQEFTFNGYLPVKKPMLYKKLSSLEKRIYENKETQIFIETPYRNGSLVESILSHINPDLKLCIAIEVTSEKEYIKTKKIKEWKKTKLPDLHKRTAVFLLGL